MRTLLWASGLVLGLGALAPAATYTYTVARDNFNNTAVGSTTVNRGSAANDRAANVLTTRSRTWYGDWSATDKADIKSKIAAAVLAGDTYSLTFRVTMHDDPGNISGGDAGDTTFEPSVAAFYSASDWVETQAANDFAATGVNWQDPTAGNATVTFWGLPQTLNTALVLGDWFSVSDPVNDVFKYASAALDGAVITALTDTANFRGLRMSDPSVDGWNMNIRADESGWGKPVLILDVSPVPEPASLGMLALGGLALLRRRR